MTPPLRLALVCASPFVVVALGLGLRASARWETARAAEPRTKGWSVSFKKPSHADLKARLTRLQYEVTQREATEPPFHNEFWNTHQDGIYVGVVSGEPLFSSKDKFDSGTGWPSFTRPLEMDHIQSKTDYKLILPRSEVRSAQADSHLGHLFDDGPGPTGLRYCINSAALRFIPGVQGALRACEEVALSAPAARHVGSVGSVNTKIAPSPAPPSVQIRPPCASTASRQKPSPGRSRSLRARPSRTSRRAVLACRGDPGCRIGYADSENARLAGVHGGAHAHQAALRRELTISFRSPGRGRRGRGL